MKKNLFILSLAVFLSCAKRNDYKCTCDVTGQWNGRYTSTIHHQTEGEADKECKDYGKGIVDGYGTSTCYIEKQ